tara:strand:- start:420 stop:554 length:135 start_codon:yes stop_codon:yes gene_type:complete
MTKKSKTKVLIQIDSKIPKHYPKVMKNPKKYGFVWDTTIYDLDD